MLLWASPCIRMSHVNAYEATREQGGSFCSGRRPKSRQAPPTDGGTDAGTTTPEAASAVKEEKRSSLYQERKISGRSI